MITKELSDVLKAATSVSDATGKSVLVTDVNGNFEKVTSGITVKGLAVESAGKITSNNLTNEDLNDFSDDSIQLLRASSSNTCKNKPAGVLGFHALVYGSGITTCTQLLTETATGKIYKRYKINGVWNNWKRILTEDDLTSVLSRIATLEARAS